jgi:spore coat protein U-like protein
LREEAAETQEERDSIKTAIAIRASLVENPPPSPVVAPEERFASLFPVLFLAVAIPLHTSAGKQTAGRQPAARQTATLSVTATITDHCTISTAPSTFGEADPMGAHVPAQLPGSGTITTTCNSGASPVVTLGKGWNATSGSTNTAPVGQLANRSNRVEYALYRDSSHSTQWGNIGAAPSAIPASGIGRSTTVYYGLVAGGQIPRSGSYPDPVVVTVSF